LPRTPIFQLFSPDDAYAIVFFDPSDRMKLATGEVLTLHVTGIERSIAGHVSGFYPELSALPSALTRYFWQQERWSQYSPVRIDFEGLNAAERRRLSAWGQLSASRWEWPTQWLARSAHFIEMEWPWVGQQTNVLWLAIVDEWRRVTRSKAEDSAETGAAPPG
jgi:hypothetical protein